MRLSTAIKRLNKEYEKAKDNQHILKPLSYALYKVWKWADAYEKARARE